MEKVIGAETLAFVRPASPICTTYARAVAVAVIVPCRYFMEVWHNDLPERINNNSSIGSNRNGTVKQIEQKSSKYEIFSNMYAQARERERKKQRQKNIRRFSQSVIPLFI